MTSFRVHDLTTAPPASRDTLERARRAFGFVPNLLDEAALSPAEVQVALLAVSVENGCRYCVAAHSAVGLARGLPADELTALRRGRPLRDPRLEAVRRFASVVVARRGHLDLPEVERFLAAGFSRAQLLEVLAAVALKTLSNYTNHLAETPVDRAFAAQAWEPEAAPVSA